jgi:hypothetical protein
MNRTSIRRPLQRASFLLALFAGSLVFAAGDDVAPERQALILMRALAYDNNLKSRAGDTLAVGVVFKQGVPASEGAGDAIFKSFKALENVKVQDLPVKVFAVPYANRASLKPAVTAHGIDVLYICTGLESEIDAIKEFSRGQHVLTIGSKIEFLNSGLSLGVFSVDGKNTITVNLAASRDEGAAFGSELLRLAKVIK